MKGSYTFWALHPLSAASQLQVVASYVRYPEFCESVVYMCMTVSERFEWVLCFLNCHQQPVKMLHIMSGSYYECVSVVRESFEWVLCFLNIIYICCHAAAYQDVASYVR